MHTDFTRIAHTFITGLFCGWLYIGTKNLKLSVFLHFLNNLFAAIETIIAYRASNTTVITFLRLRFLIFLIVGIVMFVRLYKMRQREVLGIVRKARENGEYEAFLEKKKKYINYIEMLPDENGEEVISLSAKERISGFFSPAMIVFVVAVFIQMLYYISFSLV
jgi:hypothetical protein